MGWRPGPRLAMRDTGRSAAATALTGLFACASPEVAAGTTAATVVLPGLLAPDVASGQGLPPVKGSGLG